MPFNSTNKGSKCVSMTWRGQWARQIWGVHVIGCHSTQETGVTNALDDCLRHMMPFNSTKRWFEMRVDDVAGNGPGRY